MPVPSPIPAGRPAGRGGTEAERAVAPASALPSAGRRRAVLATVGLGASLLAVAGSGPVHAEAAAGLARELARGSGLLVVATWEAKEGQADKVADILQRFLPQAQADAGVKLFLIGRGTENPSQFLFYELFADEAAYAAHQASAHFKSLIAGEALPLLSKRERARYTLL